MWAEFLKNLNAGWTVLWSWLDYLVFQIQTLPGHAWNFVWVQFADYSMSIAHNFPDTSSDISTMIADSEVALSTFTQYIVVADYVMNMPTLGMAFAIIIAFELFGLAMSFVKLIWQLLPFA